MKITQDEEIYKEVSKKYNDDPEGWKVSASRRGSRLDLYIYKNGHLWQLKTEILTPYKKIGLGGKIKTKEEIDHGFDFGWRPLSEEKIKKILEELKEQGELSQSTVEEVLRISPKSFFDIDEEYVFQGPIAFSDTPLQKLSKSQKKLDMKLAQELDKLVFYDRGSMYR